MEVYNKENALRIETPEQKNKYRTKSQAKATEDMPDKIPVITNPSWEYALSFHQNEYSFMLTEPGNGAGSTCGGACSISANLRKKYRKNAENAKLN